MHLVGTQNISLKPCIFKSINYDVSIVSSEPVEKCEERSAQELVVTVQQQSRLTERLDDAQLTCVGICIVTTPGAIPYGTSGGRGGNDILPQTTRAYSFADWSTVERKFDFVWPQMLHRWREHFY